MAQDEKNFARVHAREAEFHDRVAAQSEVRPPTYDDPLQRSVLEGAEPITGREVLDLGCGDGDLTLQLAGAGARVTALDLSQGMIDLARRRVENYLPHAQVEFVAGSAESTPFEDESFDMVVGKWVLHHLDLERGVNEVHRVLRPGGRGVFVETSALNPVLAGARRLIYRLNLATVGTPDEHPLTRRDIRYIEGRFRRCDVDHPDFILFWIFARNVLRYRPQRVADLAVKADNGIARWAPRLGFLSYYMRVTVEK